VLARANRIVRADDYRNTVRRGRKSATAHCVVYVRASSAPTSDSRFGFIVAKTVGNAVVRNTVRRRLKAVAHEILVSGVQPRSTAVGSESSIARVLPEGTDVVIRALPGSIEVPWSTLLEEIAGVIDKTLVRSHSVESKGISA
jgi:ribonuclease P protein component